MRKRYPAIALSAFFLALSAARAQPPAAAPSGAMPPNAPQRAPAYGEPITLAQAKIVAAAAEAEAAKSGDTGYVIAIVQPSGDLVYFEKMDESTYISIQWAQAKARMAALYRSPSGNLPPNGASLPAAMPLPGGLPIVYHGKTIGAIGVSGAERAGDSKLGQIGIDALERQ